MSDLFLLCVGGCEIVVNMPDRSSVLRQVQDRIRQRAGFAVATINLDHLVKLRRMEAFRSAYVRQDLVTADGNPVVWLSRLAGRPVSLVSGSDLVEPLAALAADERAPVALLGATPDTLARAAQALTERHPELEIAACLAPGQGFDPNGAEAGALIDALRRSGARMAFLALGAPKQEMFAARCREELPDMGFVSIGAGLDFIAQSQRRAPRWVRRIAMEWLWRLLSNPLRLAGRYVSCAFEFPALAFGVLARGRA